MVRGAPIDIGATVRIWRRRMGLTQRQLAELAGVSREAVARIETGQRIPRADTFLRLLAAAGVEATFFEAPVRGGREAEGRIPPDVWQLLVYLSRCAVQGVLIGETAALLQGAPVKAQEVEICAPLDVRNRPRLRRLGRILSHRKRPLEIALKLRVRAPLPLTYGQLLRHADLARLGKMRPHPLLVASVDDLIEIERARGESRDTVRLHRLLGIRAERAEATWAGHRPLTREGGYGTLPRR